MKKDKRIKGRKYRQCGSKIRYRSEGDVRAAKRKCEAKRGKELDFYYCMYCNGYHLTSALEPMNNWED